MTFHLARRHESSTTLGAAVLGRTGAIVAWASLVMLTTGCSTIHIPSSPFSHPSSELDGYAGMEGVPQLPSTEAEEVYNAVRQARSQGGIVLHVPGDSPPTRVLPLPTDGRSVYISNLLKQTGVQKKLGTIEATLFRHSATSIAGIPLECKMDDDAYSVRPEFDYALQPGDRLRVKKATHPAIQGFVNAMLGM
ncbi:hypothetical protein K227x_11030 [Rubripirellula lacrimiformis]|uniref:Uncharacterized protein n=1 Tax=Rubripirellula lacrimiformis TaxID=1930273 RepID=A0A517N6G3_9BACT|nr:hypothetical protein [Rubripirellula lacrimiformis]QDT02725.1 hypothetical protein K227x_11030 [Rubripirellula lacrimiformis]